MAMKEDDPSFINSPKLETRDKKYGRNKQFSL